MTFGILFGIIDLAAGYILSGTMDLAAGFLLAYTVGGIFFVYSAAFVFHYGITGIKQDYFQYVGRFSLLSPRSAASRRRDWCSWH